MDDSQFACKPGPALRLSVALSAEDVRTLSAWHAAVVAAERERCAKVCEAEHVGSNLTGTSYTACTSHRFHRYSMAGQVNVTTPIRLVCPICAGMAKNVSGPHLPGLGA